MFGKLLTERERKRESARAREEKDREGEREREREAFLFPSTSCTPPRPTHMPQPPTSLNPPRT